ncbi:MAG TPA: polysaccharide deacetylase family protein [Nitrospira sp.]|jgi:peptidoglycan/xylan/chitin deacetylase (PgdA/CDA1 family)|nr:polysaccharide deacetylase family protein [Nitrospira sp.]
MTLHASLARSVRKVFGSLSHVITGEPVIALTFDDGPDAESTPRVLDLLEKYGAQATFFLVGQAAAARPHLVQRIAAAGHAIGLHSWDHRSFVTLSRRERRQQMGDCARALAPYHSRLFRPPYGEQTVWTRLEAFIGGYEVVGWNVNSGDWYESNAAVLSDHLLRTIKPGDIVLLHDTLFDNGQAAHGTDAAHRSWTDRETMLQALDRLLERFTAPYRFVTVPTLLACGEPRRTFWFQNVLGARKAGRDG